MGNDIASLTETEVCVSGRVAPSLFVVGCEKCATTSLYNDMSEHFRQLDTGKTLLEGESEEFLKSKHYFDTYYENGEEWYVSHYSNCSSEGLASESMAENWRLTGASKVRVAADFTPSYLENSESAKRIYKTYKGSTHQTQLRFVNILRDPADRLFSYFIAGKADGTLDLTGFEAGTFTTACLEDPTDCEALQSLTFDDWVTVQLERAADCVAEDPDMNLWPSCGTSGLFGSLYSLQLGRFLKYFDAQHPSRKLRQPSRGTKAVIFLPFLISCTRTDLRIAELGCLASIPTFSSTMPLAWEEPPKGLHLMAVPKLAFL